MPKQSILFPQAMCITIVQSLFFKWVTSRVVYALNLTVYKLPYLYKLIPTFVHRLVHTHFALFVSVNNDVMHIIHRAYKELIISKLNLINR